MSKSPLAVVKERFSNKEGLLAAVKALATDELWNGRRLNSDKGLDHVSNKKLLHLHDVLSSVKKDHGSRSKLIGALVDAEKRGKDDGYRTRLERFSTPELVQQLNAVKRRAKVASAKAAPKVKAAAKPPKPVPKAKAAPKAKPPLKGKAAAKAKARAKK